MRRGPYRLDLRKQVKVRIDEDSFYKMEKVAEKKQITKSQLFRNLLEKMITEMEKN